jgi:hypothetical protein
MISYTEFEANKWIKTGLDEWTRLGVTVTTDGAHYIVKFRYDSPSGCYYSLYRSIYDTTMSELIEAIKYGINYILTHKSHSKRLTPKYKRTLNNWLYVD